MKGESLDLGMASAVARAVTSITPEREAQLEQTIFDLAFGYCVLLPLDQKPPSSKRLEQYVVRDEDGEPEMIRVYIEPPDPQMLRTLIEQNIGRAGIRGVDRPEQEIRVMHAIPGWEDEEEEVRSVNRVESEVDEVFDEELLT